MPILIDTTYGTYEMVFADLLDIVRCDPGLSTQMQLNGRYRVNYTQKQGAVSSSSRLLSIAGSSQAVVVKGVGSGYEVYPGVPITAYAGMTFLPPEKPEISIDYDVTEAGGGHYWVFDTSGRRIYLPRPVLLYHEFAHAYHHLTGDLPSDEAQAEIQAMADENVFRGQLSLPLRHSSNHDGGVGAPEIGGIPSAKCKPAYDGWSPGWKCAVATAATGSADASRVTELRRARSAYRRLSWWGALTAEPALDLYAQFGRSVARDMADHPGLRDAMLWYAVVPVCHVLHLAEAHLSAVEDTPELLRVIEGSLSEYVAALGETGRSTQVLRAAADSALDASRTLASQTLRFPAVLGDPDAPDQLFQYLGRAIASADGTTDAFAWGLEGLSIFLDAAASLSAGRPDVPASLSASLGDWTARPPLPAAVSFDVGHARQELSVLSERLYTRTDTRARFAEHLLANWPNRTADSLQRLLHELGYLPPPGQA